MKIFFYALLVLVFVLACTLPSGETGDSYKIGYSGLRIQYLTFPEKIYENEDFFVQLQTSNEGAYDVSNAVVVFGYPKSFFSLKDAEYAYFELKDTLLGRSRDVPVGDTDIVDIVFHAKPIFASEEQKFDITATVCYEYKTEAEMLACIGPRSGPGSCNFQSLNRNLNMTAGQGAPLAVTEVEETIIETTPGKIVPRFRFVVENKDKGTVFRNPKTNVEKMCSASGVGDDLNRFDFKLQLSQDYKYDSKSPTSGQFSCPQRIKLDNNKVEVVCSLKDPIDAGTTFNTLFRIDLEYGYSSTESQQVTVLKASSTFA
ncbi:hypothetical protein KY311_02320 [Candidatus Woesearchaeota archaeon]|nr:hypothetical protein [Candidatus Woesearchaeota archaeon]